ncbi:MAG: MarR family transcriptional regulator [Candidatus Bathyarchaeota archaeon]|nr:MarR family transcriptional regulator [Candidatus Bathyarchaeota archaeon]
MTNNGYEKLHEAFLGVLEDIVRFRGTEPTIACIYSMIVLSPEPLTQEKISEKTGYSRSQISRYLSNLEQRGLIRKESKPGSRTQLYGERAKSFFDEFKRTVDISERFVTGKLDVIESILDEWNNLSDEEKNSDEAKRLHEVVIVFEAWFATYLELVSDFNVRFREKMNELERELFPL